MRVNAQLDGRPLDGSDVRSYFLAVCGPKYTELRQFACAWVSVVCNVVFRLTISCCVPEIFAIKSRSCAKSRRNFDVLGAAKFRGKGPPNFLTEFYKSGSPSNMWQSLLTFFAKRPQRRFNRRRKKEYRRSKLHAVKQKKKSTLAEFPPPNRAEIC